MRLQDVARQVTLLERSRWSATCRQQVWAASLYCTYMVLSLVVGETALSVQSEISKSPSERSVIMESVTSFLKTSLAQVDDLLISTDAVARRDTEILVEEDTSLRILLERSKTICFCT